MSVHILGRHVSVIPFVLKLHRVVPPAFTGIRATTWLEQHNWKFVFELSKPRFLRSWYELFCSFTLRLSFDFWTPFQGGHQPRTSNSTLKNNRQQFARGRNNSIFLTPILELFGKTTCTAQDWKILWQEIVILDLPWPDGSDRYPFPPGKATCRKTLRTLPTWSHICPAVTRNLDLWAQIWSSLNKIEILWQEAGYKLNFSHSTDHTTPAPDFGNAAVIIFELLPEQ